MAVRTGGHRLIQKFQKNRIFFTLLPAFLWYASVQSRNSVISLFCLENSVDCLPNKVPFFDRISIGLENGMADTLSFWTQNLSGIFALLIPAIYHLGLALRRRKKQLHCLHALFSDWTIILQAMAWNGLLTEIIHLLTNRPRPFVYLDPLRRGAEAAHYISFYSGHTSFASASLGALFLVMYFRPVASSFLVGCAFLGESLVFLTATFRVFAGRHFISDVLVGGIAGQLVALLISYLNRKEVSHG